MPHSSSHVIISALKTPTKPNGKRKVWHYVLALLLLTLLVGVILGRCSAG